MVIRVKRYQRSNCDECIFRDPDNYSCNIDRESGYIDEDCREDPNDEYSYLPCKYNLNYNDNVIPILIELVNNHPEWFKDMDIV